MEHQAQAQTQQVETRALSDRELLSLLMARPQDLACCPTCGAAPEIRVQADIEEDPKGPFDGPFYLVHKCAHCDVSVPFFTKEFMRLVRPWNNLNWFRHNKQDQGATTALNNVLEGRQRLPVLAQHHEMSRQGMNLRTLLESIVQYYQKTSGVGHSKALFSGTGYILGGPVRPVVVALHHQHGQALSPGNAVSLQEFPLWSTQNRRPLIWDNAPLHYLFHTALTTITAFDESLGDISGKYMQLMDDYDKLKLELEKAKTYGRQVKRDLDRVLAQQQQLAQAKVKQGPDGPEPVVESEGGEI